MALKHCTTTYDQCLVAIKLLTFRCLPYRSCGVLSEEEQSELEEECNTLTGYGTLSMKMVMLYPCSSGGARLVFSRPRKSVRKSWPSACNASEVQAFYDKQLSGGMTASLASRRRSSRISTPISITPEPDTPISPSYVSLTWSPSSCGSTSMPDTPISTLYTAPNYTMEGSPTRETCMPLQTSKNSRALHHSASSTSGADGCRVAPGPTTPMIGPPSFETQNQTLSKSYHSALIDIIVPAEASSYHNDTIVI